MTGKTQAGHASHAPTSAWLAPLFAVLIIQIAASGLARLVPTTAPLLGPRIDWPATQIGYLASVLTISSVLFLLLGLPLARRFGPMRSLQLGLGLGALGALLCGLPFAAGPLLGSLLMGLGLAPSMSVANEVLHRHAPRQHMSLIFSIKQAGVPLGGVLAGLALPSVVQAHGVPAATWVCALFALAALLVAQPMRRRIDAQRDRSQTIGWRALLSLSNARRPLATLTAAPALRRMGMAGLCLGFGQSAWFTFFVTYLVLELHWLLVEAGALFALMQACSVLGRPLLGWLADRTGSGLRVLKWTTVTSALSTFALAAATSAWPTASIIALALVAGCTVSSWNGVQMAEVARRSEPGAVAESTAGATMLLFAGFVVGPTVFSLMVAAGTGHRLAFGLVGVITLLALVPLRQPDHATGHGN